MKTSWKKRILIFGSIVWLGVLFYALIWLPLTTQIVSLQQEIKQTTPLLHWMQASNQQINKLKSRNNSPASSQKNIIFEAIAFDDLIARLIKFDQQGMQVTELTATKADAPGIVNATVKFKS